MVSEHICTFFKEKQFVKRKICYCDRLLRDHIFVDHRSFIVNQIKYDYCWTVLVPNVQMYLYCAALNRWKRKFLWREIPRENKMSRRITMSRAVVMSAVNSIHIHKWIGIDVQRSETRESTHTHTQLHAYVAGAFSRSTSVHRMLHTIHNMHKHMNNFAKFNWLKFDHYYIIR